MVAVLAEAGRKRDLVKEAGIGQRNYDYHVFACCSQTRYKEQSVGTVGYAWAMMPPGSVACPPDIHESLKWLAAIDLKRPCDTMRQRRERGHTVRAALPRRAQAAVSGLERSSSYLMMLFPLLSLLPVLLEGRAVPPFVYTVL